MSFALLRHHVITKGLRKKGPRRVVGKHVHQQRAQKAVIHRQIPKWSNCGILGLKRFE